MKLYILQELYVINHHNYWQDVSTSNNRRMIIRLKDLYRRKYVDNIYRVSEVIY